MNLERKFEPYKLIPAGKVYKVENFDVENLVSANVSNNKSKTIKTNNNYEMKVLTKIKIQSLASKQYNYLTLTISINFCQTRVCVK